MNVVWEDLVDGLVHQVQDKVLPTLESVRQKASHEFQKPRPPTSTDLVYLTDRLIVSSQPARAWPTPSYQDTGRDETRPWGWHLPTPSQPGENHDNEAIEDLGDQPIQDTNGDVHDETMEHVNVNVNVNVNEDPQEENPTTLTPVPDSVDQTIQNGDTHNDCDESDGVEHDAKETPPTVAPIEDAGERPEDTNGDASDHGGEQHENPTTTTAMHDSEEQQTLKKDDDHAEMTQSDDKPETTAEQATEPPPPATIEPITENPQDPSSAPTETLDDDDDPEHDTPLAPTNVAQNEATMDEVGNESSTPTPAPGHDSESDEEKKDSNDSLPNTTSSHDKLPAFTEESQQVPPPETTPTPIHSSITSPGQQEEVLSKDVTSQNSQTIQDDTHMVSDDEEDDDEYHDDSADMDDESLDYDDENDIHSLSESDGSTIVSAPQHETHPPASALRNSPAAMALYLDKRHGKKHYLAFSLTDNRPDDRTLLLFRRQIVQMGWWSPCSERSETPSIPNLLKTCYAINSYLELDSENVALVYCANGRTRTAIVMACYLKFAGIAHSSQEGFLHFLTKIKVSNPTATWRQLPPSLHLFFQQFDTTVELGGYLNRKPLLLRAIALQGIPVEDKPCLDIWNASQEHVYSSHPDTWGPNAPVRRRMAAGNDHKHLTLSQWADEEGFYKVNVLLEGDFLLLCRFGGNFADETHIHDPSKILFRYSNTTGFLTGGYPYELPPSKVDLSRQYAQHLDDEDFLVTLLFEASWEQLPDETGPPALSAQTLEQMKNGTGISTERIFRCFEPEAFQQGWKIILQHHSARPDKADILNFRTLHRDQGLGQCQDSLVCIALQLSNFDSVRAIAMLSESTSFSWWKDPMIVEEEIGKTGGDDHSMSTNGSNAANDILNLLDEVHVESHLEAPDISHLKEITNGWKPEATYRKSSASKGETEGGEPDFQESGWMVPSIMYPRQGDILHAFAKYNRYVDPNPRRRLERPPSIASRTMPQLPFFSHDAPAILPPPAKRPRQISKEVPEYLEFLQQDYDRSVVEQLYLELNHTGVEFGGLLDLTKQAETWTDVAMIEEDAPEDQQEEDQGEQDEIKPSSSREASMNREAKEQKQKEWEEAQKAEASQKEKKKTEEARKKEGEMMKQEDPAPDTQPKPKAPQNDGADPALKDDPDFAKYFKMLKMGMPKAQVLHAMTRDEKDQTVLDLDPNKSLKSQRPEPKPEAGDIPLQEDAEYEKYFKMLKMGLPMGAVKNAMTRDEKDPSVMDLDPKKSLKSQRQAEGGSDEGPSLKEDPEYSKYFKMLKMGLPVGAVKNALTKDGKDPGIMDLDPDKSLKSQIGGGADDGPPLKEDPEFVKYFKMLTMGLPVGAVKNALSRDGKDASIMDLDPNKSLKSQMGSGAEEDTGPPLKEDPEYSKYFKMLTMGLPVGAVKNALSRDGKDPSIMDLDPTKSVKSQLGGGEEKDKGTPLKDDPEYSKYFKMLGMGLPQGAVKNALERDGKDAAVLDMDPNESVAFQLKKKGSASKKPAKKKKRVRRKKIYWNPIDPSKLKEGSMWNIVRDSIVMDKLSYDQKEFEDLFTESADPADKKKKKQDTGKEKKKAVQVIDPKRSMNGGIVLSRLKTEHSKTAEYVNRMDHAKFDATQLKNLKEYLPDADERRGLMAYMKKGESSKEVRDKLFADCSETEKYMVTMMDVKGASEKLDAMLFRTVFKNRLQDSTEAIDTLNDACNELRGSEKLRKLMAMILTVVNQINTGGEGTMAMGFTLDALLKLNEAKAFDKKTSVLHYVVKLAKKNHEELLAFDSDIGAVIPAESVLLDSLAGDVKAIAEELEGVHETVKKEAQRLEEAGELRPMTLADLAEQRTTVHTVGGVQQFNKIDHQTGRTSMERFTLNAKIACDQAIQSIENVKKKYTALLGYFGEDEQMATGDFFGILKRFVVEWKKAVGQVDAIDRKEAKERKRAEKRAAKEKAKAEKQGKKTPKKVDRGSAASAARAAGLQLKPKDSSGTSRGGIAAMAGKSQDPTPTRGGISSMAAAAALRKGNDANGENAQRRTWTSDETGSNSKVDKAQPSRRTWETTTTESRPVDQDLFRTLGSTVNSKEAMDDKSKNNAEGSQEDFAAKAAAYRRRKEKKDDTGSGRSKFLSSAAAYRRKKSTRDLSIDDDNDNVASGEPHVDKDAAENTPSPSVTTDVKLHGQPGNSSTENKTEGDANSEDGGATAATCKDTDPSSAETTSRTPHPELSGDPKKDMNSSTVTSNSVVLSTTTDLDPTTSQRPAPSSAEKPDKSELTQADQPEQAQQGAGEIPAGDERDMMSMNGDLVASDGTASQSPQRQDVLFTDDPSSTGETQTPTDDTGVSTSENANGSQIDGAEQTSEKRKDPENVTHSQPPIEECDANGSDRETNIVISDETNTGDETDDADKPFETTKSSLIDDDVQHIEKGVAVGEKQIAFSEHKNCDQLEDSKKPIENSKGADTVSGSVSLVESSNAVSVSVGDTYIDTIEDTNGNHVDDAEQPLETTKDSVSEAEPPTESTDAAGISGGKMLLAASEDTGGNQNDDEDQSIENKKISAGVSPSGPPVERVDSAGTSGSETQVAASEDTGVGQISDDKQHVEKTNISEGCAETESPIESSDVAGGETQIATDEAVKLDQVSDSEQSIENGHHFGVPGVEARKAASEATNRDQSTDFETPVENSKDSESLSVPASLVEILVTAGSEARIETGEDTSGGQSDGTEPYQSHGSDSQVDKTESIQVNQSNPIHENVEEDKQDGERSDTKDETALVGADHESVEDTKREPTIDPKEKISHFESVQIEQKMQSTGMVGRRSSVDIHEETQQANTFQEVSGAILEQAGTKNIGAPLPAESGQTTGSSSVVAVYSNLQPQQDRKHQDEQSMGEHEEPADTEALDQFIDTSWHPPADGSQNNTEHAPDVDPSSIPHAELPGIERQEISALYETIDRAIRRSLVENNQTFVEGKPDDKEEIISFSTPTAENGLQSFFDTNNNSNVTSEMDDSSVAIMADSLQRRNADARLSDTWNQGETIQNLLSWANEAIKESDTESVRNFELPRDLNDMTDIDDESTIATYQDDASIASGWSLSRSSSYANFENLEGPDYDPPPEVSTQSAVTPARVAASILFNDSPANSKEVVQDEVLQEQDILDMGLSFQNHDFGLDTGLSFAVEDAGFDDGLGFGGSGMTYNNDDAFGGFGAPPPPPEKDEAKSPRRSGWFPWLK